MTTSIEATPVTEAEQKRRDEYVKGMRALADVLERHPEVPLPVEGTFSEICISFLCRADAREAMATAARAFSCKWDKNPWEGGGTAYFDLKADLHGLKIKLNAFRDAVCERVVTGTEEVTKKVRDPEALAAVPEIEVTETVETVVWECHSILAPSVPAQSVSAA